jgi:hypothetical protein
MWPLWGANLARAEEPAGPDTDTDTDTDDGGLTLHGHADSDAPLLHLDPMLSRPLAESLLATVERQDAELELGGHRARLFAEHWKDATTNARGVTAGFDLSHDFGFARLILHGAMSQTDARFGGGTVVNAGLALLREFHLSRWTTLWLSLGVYRQWRPGEPESGTTATLSFGGTFR